MVVEVLSPQDCLKHPSSHGLLSLPMKYHHRNPTPNKAARPQPDRRKPQRKPASPVQKAPVPLLTGSIKILKRGEELPKPEELPKAKEELPPAKENRSPPKQNQKVPDLGSTVFSGPKNPKKGPKKQTRLADPVNPALGFYAGPSSSIASPPPSSLPLPSFFAKKGAVVSNIDEAASNILKLCLNLS
uniref:pollen-specific leucine-rich repeat extensin-like protein 1 n=1 Tax=Fragaria vesca subsp. vesca TaxID=101020 RepID=UPI0005C80374|nr:PREDICTED: pollen-specific leucine-rich repeat extensin-like protein 1 [Fragaria vesca subsp. vesca]